MEARVIAAWQRVRQHLGNGQAASKASQNRKFARWPTRCVFCARTLTSWPRSWGRLQPKCLIVTRRACCSSSTASCATVSKLWKSPESPAAPFGQSANRCLTVDAFADVVGADPRTVTPQVCGAAGTAKPFDLGVHPLPGAGDPLGEACAHRKVPPSHGANCGHSPTVWRTGQERS